MTTSTHRDYKLLDDPVRINTSITNPVQAFLALKAYWMFERSGMELIVESSGKSLRRKHQRLLVARQRVAGMLIHPTACTKITDAQA